MENHTGNKPLQEPTELEFNTLKKSGMWELYPDAPQNFSELFEEPHSNTDTDSDFKETFILPRPESSTRAALSGGDIANVVLKNDNNKQFIRRFPSAAVRSDDRGRLRPDYISPLALEAIAEHFTNNENDFGATNYFLGIKPEDCKGSISRHYVDLQIGFMTEDKALIYSELKSLAANCIMALHQIKLEDMGLYREIYAEAEYISKEEYKSQMKN